jgi:O-antigen/teichoic acid export membrane protein
MNIERWISRIKDTVSLLRLKPFDTSTSIGRSRDRHRRVVLTALASAAARAVTLLTGLISVPLTVRYLGTERYGMWMTISSITSVLQFADLGLGNGLLNAVSEANGKDDRVMAQEYVSSASFMLTSIAVLLAIVFVVVYPHVSWQRLFNVSSEKAVAESGPATLVFVTCFLLNIPLGVVKRIQFGYQEGFINSVLEGVGRLFGLSGILFVIILKAGLPWLVLAMAGGPVLASLLNGLYLFGFQRPWILPHPDSVSRVAARKVLNAGLLFFVLQIVVALAFSSDSLVIAQVLGASAVTLYAVPMKLFQMVSMVLQMILSPLWPAYGEATAREDVRWIRKTLMKSLVFSLSFSASGSFLLIVLGHRIVKIWAGPEIILSLDLLLGLGVWTVLKSVGNAIAMFLNGIGIIKFQVLTAIFMGASAFALKIVLSRIMGLPGVVWSTVIAYSISTVLPMGIYIPRLLKNKFSCSESIIRREMI